MKTFRWRLHALVSIASTATAQIRRVPAGEAFR